MAQFQYAQKNGALATIDAVDAGAAQKMVSGYANADPHSGVITPPVSASEPSVISTENGRSALNGAIESHNNDLTTLNNVQNPPTTTTTKSNDSNDWAMKQVGGVTADEAKASGIDLSAYNYDGDTGYFLPKEGTTAEQNKFASDKTKINDAFSSQVMGMDASTNALINSINAIYSDRINAQSDVNKRELQAYNTMNIRGGTSRYAGGVAQSILTADENVGLDRIKAIAHEQANLIATTNENLTTKKYSAFMDNRSAIDKLTAERNSTLKDLQTKALDYQKKMKDQETQSSRESAVAGLMEQGINDPAKMLDFLNFDDKGNRTGDFTAKEIADTMKSLAPTDDLKDLTGSTKNFYTLKQKGMLPDSIANLPAGQQLFAYLRQEKQATTIYKNSVNGNTISPPPQKKDVDDIKNALKDKTLDEGGYSILGKDNYVDPFVYKQLYENWTGPEFNYSPQDFLKYFPPKLYINPEANSMLPSYLRTTLKNPKAAGGA